jgi:hypothetical protein
MKAKVLVSVSVSVFVLGAAAGCTKSEQPAPAAQPAAAPVPAASPITGIVAPTPAPAAPAAAAAPAGPAAIASADGETSGLRVEVTELKRGSGGTVNLKFAMINDSDKQVGFSYDYGDSGHGATDYNSIGGVHLIDQVGKKKYFVARDSENKCLCSQGISAIPTRGRTNLWAKFPAPPDGVDKISIVVPHFTPMDDVPLSR